MEQPIPYGMWSSPTDASMATSAGIRFADAVRVANNQIYWVESRPNEGGRSVVVTRDRSGEIIDLGPDGFDARSRVHEYGGGAYGIADGEVFAASFDDQRWYRLEPDPVPITPPGARYADLETGSDRWGFAVREIHQGDGEPINDLVRLDLTGAVEPLVIDSGHDFYAAPRLSPDERHLAWIAWDHPLMPWDGTDLWVAEVDSRGTAGSPQHIAGGPGESVLQPEWSPAGVLHFASDRTGWWNLYRHNAEIEPVLSTEADHAWEPWNFGYRRYVFLEDGRIVTASDHPAGDRLQVVEGGSCRELDFPGTSAGSWLAPRDGRVVLVASSYDRPPCLVELDVDGGGVEVLRAPGNLPFPDGFASPGEPITFDTPDGPAHAIFYPPAHPEIEPPEGALPPLIVTIHGGPTSSVVLGMSVERLFWTSRGFAVVDVDYGGSTGHGRAYRERLNRMWGVVDVRDCALAARHLAESNRVDPDRMTIKGGSAGGFTALMALARHDVFAAGAARYPVTDLTALAAETHKFESRYLDSLIGPYPKTRQVYESRSPLNHADRINAPVLLLQGSDDKVVPPGQPKAMRDALALRGVPVEYIEFPGEGHGFRSADARRRALEAEYEFFVEALQLG